MIGARCASAPSTRRIGASRMDHRQALLRWGLLVAPRIVRGRPSQVKGAFGVASRALCLPTPPAPQAPPAHRPPVRPLTCEPLRPLGMPLWAGQGPAPWGARRRQEAVSPLPEAVSACGEMSVLHYIAVDDRQVWDITFIFARYVPVLAIKTAMIRCRGCSWLLPRLWTTDTSDHGCEPGVAGGPIPQYACFAHFAPSP
jgi:hypothetical protein